MSEKRFEVIQDSRVQTEYFIYDNENKISRNITDYPFNDQDVCSRIVMLLNEADNRIKLLEKRSRQLFLMERVIDRMLSKEEQIGFYNMVELEFYNMVELEMIMDE